MKFSLVVATVERTSELGRFLEHLAKQTYSDFELIVVDQNGDDRLGAVLAPYCDRFAFSHRRVAPRRGSSLARNIGIRCARGDVISFPDDDCWYGDAHLLERVAKIFRNETGLYALTGKTADEHGCPSLLRWSSRGGLITRGNVWRRAVEHSTFLRRDLVQSVGCFDEVLGPPFTAGEGTDYLLRATQLGFRVVYYPEIIVNHPQVAAPSRATVDRAYRYSVGFGRVLRKHQYPFWVFCYHCARPLCGAALALFLGRSLLARYYLASFRGKLDGWSKL